MNERRACNSTQHSSEGVEVIRKLEVVAWLSSSPIGVEGDMRGMQTGQSIMCTTRVPCAAEVLSGTGRCVARCQANEL